MRRSTLQSTTQRPRPSFGRPYRLYTEVSNAGKNIAGTKLRVKWKFGWSDEGAEHEVEFIYSAVSGKKNVYEDGTELHSESASLFSSDFNYSWNSPNCNHVFRIEAQISLATENVFYFFIDGQNFNDMSTKRPKTILPQKIEDETAGGSGRYESLVQNSPRPSSGLESARKNGFSVPSTPRTETSAEFYDGRFEGNGSSRPHVPSANPPTSTTNPRPTSADPRRQSIGPGVKTSSSALPNSSKQNSARSEIQSPTNVVSTNVKQGKKPSKSAFDLFDDDDDDNNNDIAPVSNKSSTTTTSRTSSAAHPSNKAKATKSTDVIGFDLLDTPTDSGGGGGGDFNTPSKHKIGVDLYKANLASQNTAVVFADVFSAPPQLATARPFVPPLMNHTAASATHSFDFMDLPVPVSKPTTATTTTTTTFLTTTATATGATKTAPMNPFDDFVISPVKAPPAASKPNPFDVLALTSNPTSAPANVDPFSGLSSKPIAKTGSTAPQGGSFVSMTNSVPKPNLNPTVDPFTGLNPSPIAAHNVTPSSSPVDPFAFISPTPSSNANMAAGATGMASNMPNFNLNNTNNNNMMMQKNTTLTGSQISNNTLSSNSYNSSSINNSKAALKPVDLDSKLLQIEQDLGKSLSLNNSMTANPYSSANQKLSLAPSYSLNAVGAGVGQTTMQNTNAFPQNSGNGNGFLNKNAPAATIGGYVSGPGSGVNASGAGKNAKTDPFNNIDWNSVGSNK